MKVGVIPQFEGEYFFLSNFYRAPFAWRNVVYPTAEHAFQNAKTWYTTSETYLKDVTAATDEILAAKTPAEAKRLGQKIKIDVDAWEKQKVWHMREIVHAKFVGVEGLAGQLINTGVAMLVEGNTWDDTFWGRCNGRGFNTLGSILMEERGYWLKGDFNGKSRE